MKRFMILATILGSNLKKKLVHSLLGILDQLYNS